MKNQILLATVLTLVTGALAAPVLAKSKEGHGGARMPSFEMLDADGNGELSQAELRSGGKARLAEVDSNGDGLLSAEEMIAHQQERMKARTAKMIERFDKDGDGALSLEEMPRRRGAQNILDQADIDGNGTISKAEFDTAQAIVKAMSHQMKQRGPFHMRGERGHKDQN